MLYAQSTAKVSGRKTLYRNHKYNYESLLIKFLNYRVPVVAFSREELITFWREELISILISLVVTNRAT